MYLITTCTADRKNLFGSIRSGKMALTRLGELVEAHWRGLPEHHGPRVQLDSFIVMPNHFHGIITILPLNRFPAATSIAHLGNLVGGFESSVTREWNVLRNLPGGVVWQPRFHEHIIRHERALQRIRQYIAINPQQWTIDRENTKRTGDNEFYRWLEEYCRKSAPVGTVPDKHRHGAARCWGHRLRADRAGPVPTGGVTPPPLGRFWHLLSEPTAA
jgi:REP element-mobilizing transposase RayT